MEKQNFELLTYEQIREIALKQNIPDNRVSIGIWAQNNGYFKKRKQINKKVLTYYFKL
jgi:hypothetical protein